MKRPTYLKIVDICHHRVPCQQVLCRPGLVHVLMQISGQRGRDSSDAMRQAFTQEDYAGICVSLCGPAEVCVKW